MESITEEEAVSLLRKYAPSDEDFKEVYDHCNHVKEIALRLCSRINDIDKDFVKTAALLHDIGRFMCPPGAPNAIRHGVVGYEILTREGLPDHARVALVHIGVGISRRDVEAQELDLPKEDMLPETKEELIITYADNLENEGEEKTEEWVENRYRRKISEEYGEKTRRFHEKIHKLLK